MTPCGITARAMLDAWRRKPSRPGRGIGWRVAMIDADIWVKRSDDVH
jgi:hypothetical protein